MGVVRSIDRADLGGASVTVTLNTETVILVGPLLQTPKDVGYVAVIAMFALISGTSASQLIARVRQGQTVSGAQIGANYVSTGYSSGTPATFGIMASTTLQSTDYAQYCVTLQQVGASGNATVSGVTMVVMSF